MLASYLKRSSWLYGPTFPSSENEICHRKIDYSWFEPDSDTEIRPQVSTLTFSTRKGLGSLRFEKFPTWSSLTRAMAKLIYIAHTLNKQWDTAKDGCTRWHHCQKARTVEELLQAKNVIIQAVQEDVYAEDVSHLKDDEEPSKGRPLKGLNPFIDDHGLLRVGGRLIRTEINSDEKRPIIIHGKHHIGLLLVPTGHQEHLFTEGAIRTARFLMVDGKRRVSRSIHHCIICRKLQGLTETQKMTDLPVDCLLISPLFTSIVQYVLSPGQFQRAEPGMASPTESVGQ